MRNATASDGALHAAGLLLPFLKSVRICADSTRKSGTDMGKGDKKTRKGKTYAGSHGNNRPHSPKSKAAVKSTVVKKAAPRAAAKAAPAKKAAVKKAAPKKTAG